MEMLRVNNLNKKFNITVGIFFLLTSFSLFGLSVLFYLDPVQPVNFKRVKDNAINSCAAKFNGNSTYMGMQAVVSGDKVNITAYGLDEWEGKFNMASLIVSDCDGMSLRKICFGEACNIADLTGDESKPSYHTGLFVELEFDESNIDPRVKKDW
jgi:hypothetical protein